MSEVTADTHEAQHDGDLNGTYDGEGHDENDVVHGFDEEGEESDDYDDGEVDYEVR